MRDGAEVEACGAHAGAGSWRSRAGARAAGRTRGRRGWPLPAAGAMLALAGAVAVLALAGPAATAAGAPRVLATGTPAPSGSYTTAAGASGTVAGLKGKATLLWFVTTSCQRCQTGTQALASKIGELASDGVRVVELESAGDLGQQGPSIDVFGKRYAGRAYGSNDWTWGVASKAMTAAYDPGGYDDVYYLVSAAGLITYVNGAPAQTMPALLVAATDLGHGFTGPIGPEGVPEPAAPPLAGLAKAAAGASVDGMTCSASEQTVLHVHTHLTIFVAGKAAGIPAGIGIAPPRSSQASPYGGFVNGGRCFYWLHTHAADGIIHVESPTKKTFTLGEFFDVWGLALGPDQVGPAKGKVSAFVDGHAYHGDPRAIQLGNDVQIQLDVGKPLVKPRLIQFPSGL